jgi:Xaa-Pro aminopeptidase
MKALKLEGKNISFEADNITVSQMKTIRNHMKGVNLVGKSGITAGLRGVKDADEIKAIKKSQKITDATFSMLLKYVKPGMTEIEIAWIVEKFMRESGAQDISFPVIVASGPNSALPHAVPTNRTINRKDILLFDMGCIVDGYCSDMTRTIFIGKPQDKMNFVYNGVLEAHLMVFELAKSGSKVAGIDRKSRKFIHDSLWKNKPLMGDGKGQGRYEHGLGHGVGLEIHEEPVLSYKKKDVLKVGQVVTNEPGFYIEGEGGVRIEDIMLITKDGVESLTKSPKELIII